MYCTLIFRLALIIHNLLKGLVSAIDVYFLVKCKYCAQLYATNFFNKTFICTFLKLVDKNTKELPI